MTALIIVGISLVAAAIVYDRLTRKYLNPYKLIFVFGKKGSGKSSYMAKKIYLALKSGRPVYANFPVPGAYMIEDVRNTVGFYNFEAGAVVFLDEAGTIYDNRLFKSFKGEERDYFKLQRHYRNTVYLSSQSFDIDLKLRELTDEMYLIKKFGRVFSMARRIDRSITIVQPTAEAPGGLVDSLAFAPLLLPHAVEFTFIPKWAGLYDSFAAPQLPSMEFPLVPAQTVEPHSVFKDKVLACRDWCADRWFRFRVRCGNFRFYRNASVKENPKKDFTLEEFFSENLR